MPKALVNLAPGRLGFSWVQYLYALRY